MAAERYAAARMAFAGEQAVGCCALLRLKDAVFEVAKMAVTPAWQGRGLGRRLLAHVIQKAQELGARRLYLETNSRLTPAIRLYESVGFHHMPPEKVTPSPYKRADVYMEMDLEPRMDANRDAQGTDEERATANETRIKLAQDER
jgi:N-acetylglutamate synthase-like GNAT family acetyltransferase